jgi:hypothetical protein
MLRHSTKPAPHFDHKEWARPCGSIRPEATGRYFGAYVQGYTGWRVKRQMRKNGLGLAGNSVGLMLVVVLGANWGCAGVETLPQSSDVNYRVASNSKSQTPLELSKKWYWK